MSSIGDALDAWCSPIIQWMNDAKWPQGRFRLHSCHHLRGGFQSNCHFSHVNPCNYVVTVYAKKKSILINSPTLFLSPPMNVLPENNPSLAWLPQKQIEDNHYNMTDACSVQRNLENLDSVTLGVECQQNKRYWWTMSMMTDDRYNLYQNTWQKIDQRCNGATPEQAYWWSISMTVTTYVEILASGRAGGSESVVAPDRISPWRDHTFLIRITCHYSCKPWSNISAKEAECCLGLPPNIPEHFRTANATADHSKALSVLKNISSKHAGKHIQQSPPARQLATHTALKGERSDGDGPTSKTGSSEASSSSCFDPKQHFSRQKRLRRVFSRMCQYFMQFQTTIYNCLLKRKNYSL